MIHKAAARAGQDANLFAHRRAKLRFRSLRAGRDSTPTAGWLLLHLAENQPRTTRRPARERAQRLRSTTLRPGESRPTPLPGLRLAVAAEGSAASMAFPAPVAPRLRLNSGTYCPSGIVIWSRCAAPSPGIVRRPGACAGGWLPREQSSRSSDRRNLRDERLRRRPSTP